MAAKSPLSILILRETKMGGWAGGSRRTWAMLMMSCRNLGWRLASALSLLAMGLDIVFSNSVPSFATGSIIFSPPQRRRPRPSFLDRIPLPAHLRSPGIRRPAAAEGLTLLGVRVEIGIRFLVSHHFFALFLVWRNCSEEIPISPHISDANPSFP
jgi:hypothetical protein